MCALAHTYNDKRPQHSVHVSKGPRFHKSVAGKVLFFATWNKNLVLVTVRVKAQLPFCPPCSDGPALPCSVAPAKHEQTVEDVYHPMCVLRHTWCALIDLT